MIWGQYTDSCFNSYVFIMLSLFMYFMYYVAVNFLMPCDNRVSVYDTEYYNLR